MPGTDLSLPGGGWVRASASYHRSESLSDRVWGLYMDPFWDPTWPARYLPWENMALPLDFDEAVHAIYEAHTHLAGGGMVEVGCQGGIGRTGVVIGCLAIIDGVAPSAAVQWVRQNYIVKAVETPVQEWWVEWFGAHHLGHDAPARPKR